MFKHNALARGHFVPPGRTIRLHDITVPVYLLAGEADDITPAAQLFSAAPLLGTPARDVMQRLVPGGRIGLFMGERTLTEAWPMIGGWIAAVPA